MATTPSMVSDHSPGWPETTWWGGLRGTLSGVAVRAQPTRTTSCARAGRCASIRRAERRRTSGPVLTSPERPPWFLPTGRPMDVRRLSGTARSGSGRRRRGVQSPATRRSPNIASDAEVSVMCDGGSPHSTSPVFTRRTQPTTRRMTSRPMPGQPPANVEYRRRNTYLDPIIRRGNAS